MGFSRQEYWSGLPFPSPGDLPDARIEPRSPALQADALTSEPPRKPNKPDTKGQTLYDFIHERSKRQKVDWWVTRAAGGGNELLFNEENFSLGR